MRLIRASYLFLMELFHIPYSHTRAAAAAATLLKRHSDYDSGRRRQMLLKIACRDGFKLHTCVSAGRASLVQSIDKIAGKTK